MPTYDEYRDREDAIQRARKIFTLSGFTKNVSIAFAAYQTLFAETERPVAVRASWYNKFRETSFDDRERPECPDCGSPLFFRNVPRNDENIHSQLVCSNPRCDLVLNSEHTLDWWLAYLPKRTS